LHFCNYLPFEQDLTFYLKKFKFPLPPNFIEIGLLVLEKNIFKKAVYFHFRQYFLFEKAVALHLNNLQSPIPKTDLCQLWLQLVEWFWKRSRKCKSLQTDDGQHAIRKAHSGELYM
jgi:hypothetical protein